MPPKRSGVACKTCRRRGRKCTREVPACKSCLDKGFECEGYPLKWAGLASRGFLAGKDSSNLTKQPKTRTSESNAANHHRQARSKLMATEARSSVNEFEVDEYSDSHNADDLPLSGWSSSELQAISSLFEDTIMGLDFNSATGFIEPDLDEINLSQSDDLQSALMPTPSPALTFFSIPPDLGFILDYHIHEVAAKLCVDNNTLQNPYREYIYPLALQRPALMYACAAMSSVHYSTRQQNQSFFTEALRLRGKALSRLQEAMWSPDGALDESNLATVLMLVLCDMCMGGHSNFQLYFTFAKSLMHARGSLRTRDNFVEQYISWLDIMSSASTARKPVFSLSDIASVRGPRMDWSHDVIPCTSELFEILLEAANLYKSDEADVVDRTEQLELLKERILMTSSRCERGLPWYHLTESYRFGILLYMNLLFGKDDDEDETVWLVSSIVQHAKSIPNRSGWSDQLLWPLFHAGLKMSTERHQNWLREKLKEMQSSGGFRNVATAQEALEVVWKEPFSKSYVDLLVREGAGDMLAV